LFKRLLLHRACQAANSTSNLPAEATAAGCSLCINWHLIVALDAFKAAKRSKEKACGLYAGPGGRMAVLGLSTGGDDYANVVRAMCLAPAAGSSVFQQLQAIVDRPVLIVQLPGHLPNFIKEQQLYVKLALTYMLDQPAMLVFLGLGE
jgi:hypothetical protein